MIKLSKNLGSTTVLLLLALIAYGLTLWADHSRVVKPTALHDEKILAAIQMERALNAIEKAGPLLGEPLTSISSVDAEPEVKRAALNPNLAALVVELFDEAGVRSGDRIAVGLSGSYPGLNVAVLAACQSLELEPVIVASVAASAYGATDPDFTWLDMERVLREAELFDYQSISASLGGANDLATNLTADGRFALANAISRNDVPRIKAGDLAESIDLRREIYLAESRSDADDLRGYSLYVNVGGGAASLGRSGVAPVLHSGLIERLNGADYEQPGIAHWFVENSVPVVNLRSLPSLLSDRGIPLRSSADAAIGEGALYVTERHDLRIVWFAVALISLLLGFAWSAHRRERRRIELALHEPALNHSTSQREEDTHAA